MKALAFFRGVERVKGHSILETTRALGVNGPLEEAGKRLDLYYISTRYPDAFPSGAPFEFFTQPQADEAYELALRVVEFVSREMGS